MNQSTKNLKDKREFLNLLLLVHNAGRNAESLEEYVKYYRMKYPKKTGFEISEFDQNMQEYIKNLEMELKKEKEFLSNVARNYCTDQNECSSPSEVSKNISKWR